MTSPRHRKPSVFVFILLAAGMMLGLEIFVFRGDRPYYHDGGIPSQVIVAEEAEEGAPPAPPESTSTRMMGAYGPLVRIEPPPEPDPRPELQWRKFAVPAAEVPEGFARVVVVIDDLGVDRKHSQEIIDLPGPITAAFLPYAPRVEEMARQARAQGHEIIIHMPMEANDPAMDLGAIALRRDMDADDFNTMLDRAFAALGEGYVVGLNNHMGSRLTQDRAAMERLMTRLYERGLLFLDSRTIGNSIAAQVAADHSVAFAVRDVFLDHDPSYEGVVRALAQVEDVARRNGTAIAIGHPKPATIEALRAWLPTLAEKKLVMVPISAVAEEAAYVTPRAAEEEFIIPIDEDDAAARD